MVWFLSILPVFLLMFGLSSYFVGILCVLIVVLLASTQDDPFSGSFSGSEFLGLGGGIKILIRLFLLNKSGRGDRCFLFSGLLTFFPLPESMVLWVPATCQCLSSECLIQAVPNPWLLVLKDIKTRTLLCPRSIQGTRFHLPPVFSSYSSFLVLYFI